VRGAVAMARDEEGKGAAGGGERSRIETPNRI
jgi:hypothetical protein